MTPTLSLTLLILTAVHTVVGFPEGAPYEACASLKPRHGGINQIKPDGLTLVIQEEVNDTLREVTHYTPETTYKVMLKADGDSNVFCKGFLIQGRTEANGEILNHVGAGFVKPADENANYKLSNCFPPSGGVTHTDRSPKERVNLEWVAPPASAGPIQFRYTCVQHLRYYYANLQGPTLLPDESVPTDTPLVKHTTQPTSTVTPTSSGLNVKQSWTIMGAIGILAIIFMRH